MQNLDLPEILIEVEKRGSSFDKLLTIPEQDDWIYEDGISVSCVAYVLEIYKAAGLFGSLSNSVQATEFTVSISTASILLLLAFFLYGFCGFLQLFIVVVKVFTFYSSTESITTTN